MLPTFGVSAVVMAGRRCYTYVTFAPFYFDKLSWQIQSINMRLFSFTAGLSATVVRDLRQFEWGTQQPAGEGAHTNVNTKCVKTSEAGPFAL